MKLTSVRTLDNDVFSLVFTTDSWSVDDTTLMELFGEPQINLGGKILDSNSVILAELPDVFQSIYTTTWSKEFSLQTYPNAQVLAERYQEVIFALYTSSLATLRAKSDTYSGTDDVTI